VYAWLKSILDLPDDDALQAALAALPADGHGMTMLPFLAGERSPGWRADKRATITGLALGTTAIDICRAGLEAVALRFAAVHGLLAPLAARDHKIVASGGALARSRVWAQIIADAIGRPITVSRETEATSRGTALLALDALGGTASLGRDVAGDVFTPDAGRHARYRDALERQRRLDERV
jgi:gluconokinase